jgi:hypothetical protein
LCAFSGSALDRPGRRKFDQTSRPSDRRADNRIGLPLPVLEHFSDLRGQANDVGLGKADNAVVGAEAGIDRNCCKSRKSNDAKNLAKVEF